MDTSKLSRYDWVVVAGMILMFIALFLTWYHVEIVQRLLQELQGGLDSGSVDTSGSQSTAGTTSPPSWPGCSPPPRPPSCCSRLCLP